MKRGAGQAAALLTSLLGGAMILIRVALVPFWRRLPPAQFREWFEDNAGRIGALMRPLGAAAAIAATASATRDRSAGAVAAVRAAGRE